jgi:hypothetical protein
LFGAIVQLVDVRKGVKHDKNASERHEANQQRAEEHSKDIAIDASHAKSSGPIGRA